MKVGRFVYAAIASAFLYGCAHMIPMVNGQKQEVDVYFHPGDEEETAAASELADRLEEAHGASIVVNRKCTSRAGSLLDPYLCSERHNDGDSIAHEEELTELCAMHEVCPEEFPAVIIDRRLVARNYSAVTKALRGNGE